MIYIKISDMDFYDDAVVLIKSFYPRTEVMQYQEQAEQTRTAQDIVIDRSTGKRRAFQERTPRSV